MKISAIRSYSPAAFTGEKSKKANAAKTAAGAAMIALATAMPAQEADAQIYYPYVPYSHYYYVPRTTLRVPNCFIDGDMNSLDFDKSMNQVFSEIDAKVDPNRELSVNEVVKAERDNWHMYNFYPYNSANMRNTVRQFKMLSEVYNERGSNPNTISYSEYKKIMNDYMDQQNVTNFIMLMDLLARPRYHSHPHMTPPPPPPRHPHHRH